jgi:rhodanese-related sulfurtransferase
MYKVILTIIFSFSYLYSDMEVGCSIDIQKRECTKENPIKKKRVTILDTLLDNNQPSKVEKKRLKISENIDSILINFQNKEFRIERLDSKDKECPPYCIRPMNIKNIKTVGEFEVLEFISHLDKNKGRILVDARVTSLYKKSTIPSAINIPYSMLKKGSKYRDDILKLLGAKKLQKKWYFKNTHKLLIFDNGILDIQARKLIKTLIEVGYPQNKILYYRGGIDSWKNLGLTLF